MSGINLFRASLNKPSPQRHKTYDEPSVNIALRNISYYHYELGFPIRGYWQEAFNSDIYDNWVNPWSAGNGGGLHANGKPLHGLPCSASITIPANGIVIFVKR